MPLSREFKQTLKARADIDPAFRAALLAEAVELLLAGNTAEGKIVLRQYINATVGFDAVAQGVGRPSKSLMRMFGPAGNPTATNLFAVISYLQEATGVQLEVHEKAA